MPRLSISIPPPPAERATALDNLRVAAMLLGLVTHGVLPYTATGLVRFPIRDTTRHVAADAVYFAAHDFRMQLFFLLAGFAGACLVAKKGAAALVANRAARVALPLAVAAVVAVPLMHLLVGRHTAARGVAWNAGEAGGWVGPNFHLWFLYYLLLCTAAFLVARRFAPPRAVRAVDHVARWVIASPWKFPLLAVAVVPVLWGMRAWWVESPCGWVPRVAVLTYYLGFFAAGVMLGRHRDLLPVVGRNWRGQLLAANLFVLPVMLKLTISGNWAEESAAPPAWLGAWKAAAIFLGGLYTWLMIAGLVGLFQRHFAACTGAWKYLAGASYWCYLAGFPVQAAMQVGFAPRGVPIVVEFVLVNAVTFAVLLVSYEWCVRRTWVGVMLNGSPKAEPRRVVVVGGRVVVPEPRLVVRPVPEARPKPAAVPNRAGKGVNPTGTGSSPARAPQS